MKRRLFKYHLWRANKHLAWVSYHQHRAKDLGKKLTNKRDGI